MSIKNSNKAIITPIVLSLVMVAGIVIGLNLNNQGDNNNKIFIYPRSENKLSNIINYIDEKYVDTVDKNMLVENAIPEILKQLDPHSVYIPASEVKKMNEPIEGNFEGIGIQFNMPNDTVVVIMTISGGPSEKVGVLSGDRIVKIEDSVVAGVKMKNTDVVKMLKGKKGTKVKVSVKRKGISDLIDFEITRDKIPLYSIDVAYMLQDNIGYLKISNFSKSTHDEFKKAIVKLKKTQLKKLIMDLRGNGGGLMEPAIRIANEFLESNKLIVYTKGKASPKRESLSNEKGICKDIEVILLIDEWSASASEILAGAIQDNDRGVIIGRRSFGKGLVQQPVMFNDGSALRLTTARYYTPTGRSIQKPYNSGSENYYDDLNARYANGEFHEKDSIELNDSLRFYTKEGKIVYGGGGIMPDIFVPIDTSNQTNYFKEVVNKGIMYQFAFEYADKNRDKLSTLNTYKKIDDYLNKKNILERFIDFAEEKGIKKNSSEIEISKKILSTRLKASISRNILDNEGYYPIIKDIDITLQRGIKEFSK